MAVPADEVLPIATLRAARNDIADSDRLLPDRRRPGRQEVSPALIPLLREAAGDALSGSAHSGVSDNRSSPFRGIFIATAIAVPAWAGIGWVIALIRN